MQGQSAADVVVLLFLVVGFVALVQWRARRREMAAERNHPPLGQIVDVDGTDVHVLVAGQGPDLVLIHGASGNLRDFTFGLMDHLTDHFRVIAFDRPGLGWTARLPGYGGAWRAKGESPMIQADLLRRAASKIGVQNPIVLGHSYGGAVALGWALAAPDETAALVLVGGVAQPWPGGLGWLYDVTSSATGGALIVPLISAFVPDRIVTTSIGSIFAPQPAPTGYGAHLGTGLTLRRESTRANAQQVNTLRPHIIEMQQQYHTLNMPIELIHGAEDTIVPARIHAEVFAHDVPSAALTMLPGVGHMPQHVAPQAVVGAIERAATRAGLR